MLCHVHVLMRDEKEGRCKQGQTNNKAKQHSTPKGIAFPKKNELPRVGLEPTTLYTNVQYMLCMFVCLGYGWMGYLTFLFFLIS